MIVGKKVVNQLKKIFHLVIRKKMSVLYYFLSHVGLSNQQLIATDNDEIKKRK